MALRKYREDIRRARLEAMTQPKPALAPEKKPEAEASKTVKTEKKIEKV